MDDGIEVIFILPHLDLNTTSVSRFKSFINAFIERGDAVKIITFTYPIKKAIGFGHQLDEEPLAPIFADRVYAITPRLNLVKRLAFFALNTFDTKIWKVLNWVHQAVYRVDVFAPGKVDLEQITTNPNKRAIVIACGGPFGLYTFANELATRLKAKLVLDYRDPWTFGYVPLGAIPFIYRLSVKSNRERELTFLEKASIITTVSPSLKELFPKQFSAKISVIENGSNFSKEEVTAETPKTFNILYLGTLYDEQLADETLMKALQLFCRDKDSSQIKIQFLGSSDHQQLPKLLAHYGLAAFSEVTKRLAHKELRSRLNQASLFLQLRYGKRTDIITSKQADYLLFNKPILLPVSDEGDIADSISSNQAGFVCENVEENVEILQFLWNNFLRKEYTVLRAGGDQIETMSREIIAKKFVELVKSVEEYENSFG